MRVYLLENYVQFLITSIYLHYHKYNNKKDEQFTNSGWERKFSIINVTFLWLLYLNISKYYADFQIKWPQEIRFFLALQGQILAEDLNLRF